MELGINQNRLLIAGVIGVAALILLWMVFRPAAVRVEMVRAVRSQLLDTVDAEGRTRVKNKFTVTAPVSGKLKRIGLREGDNIVRNYPITEIDPNPPIPRAPSSTPTDWPNPYAAKVFSPASGRVLRVFEKSERYLEVGTPLLEIGDPTNIEIVVDVLSTDAVRIRPGSRMLIENTDTGPIRAQVKTIEPQALTKVSALGVEEKRVDVVGDFIEAKPNFGDNFRLDVRIVLWQGEDVLSIPNSALFRAGEDWNVYAVERGKAYLRKVEIGHRSRTDTQILSGLEEGDTVVAHPPNSLTDGARVEEE
ncbi:MAG TPA: efflux RND transporter periplasmic adaptor subunit [Pyrinomonadaceae bacterium]